MIKIAPLLAIMTLTIILFLYIRINFYDLYWIESNSMEPTFTDGNLILVRKLESIEISGNILIGDVLIFKKLSHDDDYLIKRCLGSPNDTLINFENLVVPFDGLTINCSDLQNRLYQQTCDRYEINCLSDNLLFTKNYYFMVGDNRQKSFDSRHFGFIPEELIVGKLVWVLF